ncbi:MAG: DUF998 domain-containing protein [Marinicella sp.]|nr:DUF998 domain-containing protein [Xanthomonadales bacterium]
MNIAFFLSIVAITLLITSLIVLGNRKTGYSHYFHTISELGEVGAPHQYRVAWFVFMPVGLLLLPVAYLYQESFPALASLAACVAVGYMVAALFPCDPGSPTSGSLRQSIHNLGGAVEYIGGGISLMWIAESAGIGFKVLGSITLGIAFALTFMSSKSARGLVQRIGEAVLFGSITFLVWLH